MRTLALTCGLALTVTAGCGGPAFQAGGSGGGPTDAGNDASIEAATDGPSSWCASQTKLFCEDFDEYATIDDLYASGKWTNHGESSGSFRLTSSSSPPSPPNSLEAIGGDGAAVLLVKTLSPLLPGVKHARLEFDLRIDNPGSPGLFVASGFAAIGFGAGIDDGYVALVIATGPTLEMAWGISADAGLRGDGGTEGISHVTTFPAAGRWSDRFAIDIDYAQSCVQVYDGMSAQLGSCVPLPQELLARRTLSVVLGDYVVGLGSVGQIDLEFDDVTFDAN
ncbi:MAG TPA: hypothetical protein VF765_03155 [Polyangiaceae bacterium]